MYDVAHLGDVAARSALSQPSRNVSDMQPRKRLSPPQTLRFFPIVSRGVSLLLTIVVIGLTRKSSALDCFGAAQTIQVLADQPYAAPGGFDFDGRFVTWIDHRSGEEIYLKDLATLQEYRVSDGRGNPKSGSRVSEGMVAWYEGETILARDLFGRIWGPGETRIVATFSGFGGLDIDGEWIVWSQEHSLGGRGIGGDVYAKNLRTNEMKALPSPATEWSPVIRGRWVAYTTTPSHIWEWGGAQDRHWDVLGYDLKTDSAFSIENGPEHMTPGGIDGGRVVLNQIGPYNTLDDMNVWVADLLTGEFDLVASNASHGAISGALVAYGDLATDRVMIYDFASRSSCNVSSSRFPASQGSVGLGINGVVAVWQDNRIPAGAQSLYIYGAFLGPSLSPDGEFGLLTDSPTSSQYGFDFDGRFVVWNDDNLPTGNGSGPAQVHVFDLFSGTETEISSGPEPNSEPAISNGLVVYRKNLAGLNAEILAKDLTGRFFSSSAPPQLIASVFGPNGLDVDGAWIAWCQDQNFGVGGDIHAKNLVSGTAVSVPDSGTDWGPRLADGLIAYTSSAESTSSYGVWNVLGFDLDRSESFVIKDAPSTGFGAGDLQGRYLMLNELSADGQELNSLRRNLESGAEVLANFGAVGSASESIICAKRTADHFIFAVDALTGVVFDVSTLPGGRLGSTSQSVQGLVAVWQQARSASDGYNNYVQGRLLIGQEPVINISKEKLVYDQGGDLWMINTDGTERHQLTGGPANDIHPRFSADGRRIAFSSDQDGAHRIWIMGSGGETPRQVDNFLSGNPIQFDWSPDDQRFVVSDGGPLLRIVRADGSSVATVSDQADQLALLPDWNSQDVITYALRSESTGLTRIHRIQPDGAILGLFIDAGAHSSSPRWAADASAITFAVFDLQDGTGGDIWRANSAGLNRTNVTHTPGLWEDESVTSPMGDQIYYHARPAGSLDVHRIYSATPNNGSPTVLVETSSPITSLDAAIVTEGTNNPPAQPVNLNPANGGVGSSLLPTLAASSFNDIDLQDTHRASRWQIREAGRTYANAEFDRDELMQSLASLDVPAGVLAPGHTYAWRVRYVDNHGNASPWSDETYFTTAESSAAPDRVVIVAGGGNYAGNAIINQTKGLANKAYCLSLARGIPEDQILVLSAFSDFALSDCGGSAAGSAEIRESNRDELRNYALGSWSAGAPKLILYLVDHGSSDSGQTFFYLDNSTNPAELVKSVELDAWLDDFQAANPGAQVGVVADLCYSGALVNALAPTSGQQRVIVTSATDASLAMISGNSGVMSFSNFFMDLLWLGNDFKNSFRGAQQVIADLRIGPPSSPQQIPWMEDDGDGSYSTADGPFARTFYWGRSDSSGSLSPWIQSVTPSQIIGGSTTAIALFAELRPGFLIDRVWATLIPPSAVYKNGEPISDITEIALAREGNSETWRGVASGLTEEGVYQLTFFALGRAVPDASAQLAIPRYSSVRRLDSVSAAGASWERYR